MRFGVKYKLKGKHFAILSKGIEQNTCEFVHDVFKRHIKTKNVKKPELNK